MDFNHFVDILLIDYKNESESRYVNGCVFLKNLADKRMPRKFENPKILLLQGALGFMKDFDDKSDALQIAKDEIYVDISAVIN